MTASSSIRSSGSHPSQLAIAKPQRGWTKTHLAAVFCYLLLGTGAAAEEMTLPWGTEIFEGSAEAILKSVQEIPEPDNSSTEYLLFGERFEVLKDHRVHQDSYYVYRIRTADQIDSLGTIQAGWNPWLQSRPDIRARVISPDGRAYDLDVGTLVESAADNVNDTVYRNNRIVTGPLPAVGIGAIVEVKIRTEQHRPFCPEGIVGEVSLNSFSVIRRRQIEIRAAAELPLKLLCTGRQVPLELQSEGKWNVWRFQADSPKQLKAYWTNLPASETNVPYVTFSTGQSWQVIAKHYHDIIERQIKQADLSELTKEIVGANISPLAKLQATCRVLHDRVRYTGIEFGDGAIVPRTPQETLARRYGDCKDKSSLLVAMLRACDIDAHVALLLVSDDQQVLSDAPGLNAFNHAIVWVPKQTGIPGFWIDPTDPFTPPGELPLADQDRQALVAEPNTIALVRTPHSNSDQNGRRVHQTFQLRTDGLAAITATTTGRGIFASHYRETYGRQNRDDILKNLSDQCGEQECPAPTMETTDPQDLTQQTFETKVTFSSNQFTFQDDGKMGVNLNFASTFQLLPYELFYPFDEEEGSEEEELQRTQPIVLPAHFTVERTAKIVPPAGFAAIEVPEDFEVSIGEFAMKLESKRCENGDVEVHFLLNTGNAAITVEQAEEIREAILLLTDDVSPTDWILPVTLHYEPAQFLHNGDASRAIKTIRAHLAQHPNEAFYRFELASALLQIGLGEEAREIAEAAREAAPESQDTQRLVGWVLMHNRLGESVSNGMERRSAMHALEKAIDSEQDDILMRYNYALLLEHDDAGRRYETNQASIDKARKIYDDICKSSNYEDALINYRMLLLRNSDTRALKRLAVNGPDDIGNIAFHIAAVAEKHGFNAAKRLASRSTLASDQRTVVLQTVAVLLRSIQRYDLYRQFVELQPNSHQAAEVLMQLDRFEDHKLEPKNPAFPLQNMMAKWMYDDADSESFWELYANVRSEDSMVEERLWIPGLFLQVREGIRLNYQSLRVARDIVSLYEFAFEGDDETGFVVTAVPKAEGWPPLRYLVVHQDGSYRLFALGKRLQNVGSQAEEFLDTGNLAAAKRWLSFVYELERQQISMFDAFSGTPFARIWSTIDKNNKVHLRLAATLLAARVKPTAAHYAWLNEIREDVSVVWQLQIDRACCPLLGELGRHRERAELAAKIWKRHKTAETAIQQLLPLIRLGDFDQAEALINRIEKKYPDLADRYRCLLIGKKSGHAELVKYCRSQMKLETIPGHIPATFAWRSLFTGQASDAVPYTRQILENAGRYGSAADSWHTVACLYADVGKFAEALQSLKMTVAARGDYFDPIDNWVLGRIAEHCEMHEAAKKYYERVRNSRGDASTANCEELARYRIEQIDHPAPDLIDLLIN